MSTQVDTSSVQPDTDPTESKSHGLFPGQHHSFATRVAPHPTFMNIHNVSEKYVANYKIVAGAESEDGSVQPGATVTLERYWGGVRVGITNTSEENSPQIVVWTA